MSGATTAGAAASTAPPTPPGELTRAPSTAATQAFLVDLDGWLDRLRARVDRLDADAQLADEPTRYTADVTLAMSLVHSISIRRDELVAAWDSGRVDADVLARIGVLMWGRLLDPLGAPSAFTLSEAGTLATALVDRLAATLAADPLAGSGVAGRVAALRSGIARCAADAAALGTATTAIDGASARLEAAVASKERTRIVETVTELEVEIGALERDLIKETGLRVGTARRLSELQRDFAALEVQSAAVTALAARCRSRMADAPKLAVPAAAVLGPPPAVVTENRAPADWRAARAELDEYAARFQRVKTALDQAEAAFHAPLQTRDDLRGLVGAYATRAARNGLAEDAGLATRYQAAHDALWSAPCELEMATGLAQEYVDAVRRAVGADLRTDDLRTDDVRLDQARDDKT